MINQMDIMSTNRASLLTEHPYRQSVPLENYELRESPQ